MTKEYEKQLEERNEWLEKEIQATKVLMENFLKENAKWHDVRNSLPLDECKNEPYYRSAVDDNLVVAVYHAPKTIGELPTIIIMNASYWGGKGWTDFHEDKIEGEILYWTHYDASNSIKDILSHD